MTEKGCCNAFSDARIPCFEQLNACVSKAEIPSVQGVLPPSRYPLLRARIWAIIKGCVSICLCQLAPRNRTNISSSEALAQTKILGIRPSISDTEGIPPCGARAYKENHVIRHIHDNRQRRRAHWEHPTRDSVQGLLHRHLLP